MGKLKGSILAFGFLVGVLLIIAAPITDSLVLGLAGIVTVVSVFVVDKVWAEPAPVQQPSKTAAKGVLHVTGGLVLADNWWGRHTQLLDVSPGRYEISLRVGWDGRNDNIIKQLILTGLQDGGADGTVDVAVDSCVIVLADPGFTFPADTEAQVQAMLRLPRGDAENWLVTFRDAETIRAVVVFPGLGEGIYTFRMRTVRGRVIVSSLFADAYAT